MPKVYPEMVKIGRPPRLESTWRHSIAREGLEACCNMLNAMLDELYPERVAHSNNLSRQVTRLKEEFYEKAAFLFDIAPFRGLAEEPTQSVYLAFLTLLDSDTVQNVQGGHEIWRYWHHQHFGPPDDIYVLVNKQHAEVVNPQKDPTVLAMFYRAHALLKRMSDIARFQEGPITTDIADIMPEEIRLSVEGSVDFEKATYERPWLLLSENYVVYRHRLEKELGISYKTMDNYSKEGKTKKTSTYWPTPINSYDTRGKKFYDPKDVLKALTELPKNFSKNTPVDTIISMLMSGELCNKIVIESKQKGKEVAE